jgi:hypothetical protein
MLATLEKAKSDKGLKLHGSQAYDISSDQAAVVS